MGQNSNKLYTPDCATRLLVGAVHLQLTDVVNKIGAEKELVMASTASAPDIISQNNLTFGVLPLMLGLNP